MNQTEIQDLNQRLDKLEECVNCLVQETNKLSNETKDVIAAFNAAQGAFTVLEWLAKVTKPIVILVTTVGGAFLFFKGLKG